MCHSLQPWGYVGLAFPMINIQRDSHLEPRPAMPGFGFIYFYFFFLFDFSFVLSLFFLFPSAFSYQHVVRLFFDKGVPSITHAHLCSLT